MDSADGIINMRTPDPFHLIDELSTKYLRASCGDDQRRTAVPPNKVVTLCNTHAFSGHRFGLHMQRSSNFKLQASACRLSAWIKYGKFCGEAEN